MKIAIMLFGFLLLLSSLAIFSSTGNATTISLNSADPHPDSHVNGFVQFSVEISSASPTLDVKAYVDDYYWGIAMLNTIGGGKYGAFIIVDTSTYGDGWHQIRYDVYSDTGNDSKSFSYLFDNTPPEIRNFTVHYVSGYEASPGKGYIYFTAEIEDVSSELNESSIVINASSLGYKGNLTMYDDGQHNDSASGDGIFGSDAIYIYTPEGKYYVNLTANDSLGNEITVQAPVIVDDIAPKINSASVISLSGSNILKAGDAFRFIANVEDNTDVHSVEVDASAVGIPWPVSLIDDGRHGDGAAGDDVYGSDILVVPVNKEGTFNLPIYAYDGAMNLII